MTGPEVERKPTPTSRFGGNEHLRFYTATSLAAEIEEALVPAFIIEELEAGLFTVFVPSVPTALSGAVYILSQDRVHRVNVSVAHVIKAVSRWGSGSKDLVAAMERRHMAERYDHR